MTALKILQITDLHVLPKSGDTMLGINTEYYFQETLKYAHTQNGPFDLILLTGDLAQDPCPDSYQRICGELLGYQTRCMCLPGNHDDFSLMQRYLNQNTISCCKQIILNNWQIIGLNSQKPNSPIGELALDELSFLAKSLNARPDLPALIALHHHCLACGSGWLDTMQIQNSADFLTLLQEFPQVKAVTCGHVHQEISAQINQIRLFTTPSSCFQFTPNSSEFSIDVTAPGYRVFELLADGNLQSECYRLPMQMDHLDRTALEY